MSEPVRQRRRARKPVRRGAAPVLDSDVHAYVVARLDAQIRLLEDVRRELVRSRSTRPGARWYAAVGSMIAAQQYVGDLGRALRGCVPGHPPEPAPEESAGGRGSHVV